MTVAQTNDQQFTALRGVIEKFDAGKSSEKGGAAMHNYAPDSPVFAPVAPNGPPGTTTPDYYYDQKAFGEEDNASTYTPQRTMAASNIDRLTAQIQHNLDAADKVMKESWKTHPDRDDPALNAMRQRLQNVIDLQRVLAARLDDVAGVYFSNAKGARLNPKSEQANYETQLAALVDAETAEERAAQSAQAQEPQVIPFGDVEAAKHGAAGDVAVALRIQEYGLSVEAPRLEKSCGPAPSPTP